MKGMLFFIVGIIIVFGVFIVSQNNSNVVNNGEQAAKQEIKQEIKHEHEKMDVEINVDDLEKVE